MMRIRTRYICASIAIADAALVFGGVPLQRYSWSVAAQTAPDSNLVLMLIAANVGLLLLALGGLLASMVLARRGVRFAFRHAARFFARPSRA
jgi:hypothetical protein